MNFTATTKNGNQVDLTAEEILNWLDFDKGTATAADIEAVWSSFTTTDGIEGALKAIGCTRDV